jgi:hypothetical protein
VETVYTEFFRDVERRRLPLMVDPAVPPAIAAAVDPVIAPAPAPIPAPVAATAHDALLQPSRSAVEPKIERKFVDFDFYFGDSASARSADFDEAFLASCEPPALTFDVGPTGETYAFDNATEEIHLANRAADVHAHIAQRCVSALHDHCQRIVISSMTDFISDLCVKCFANVADAAPAVAVCNNSVTSVYPTEPDSVLHEFPELADFPVDDHDFDRQPSSPTSSLQPLVRHLSIDTDDASLMDYIVPQLRADDAVAWDLYESHLPWEEQFGPNGKLPFGFFHLPGVPQLLRLSDSMTPREREAGRFLYDDISHFRRFYALKTDIRQYVEAEHAKFLGAQRAAAGVADNLLLWDPIPYCEDCSCRHFPNDRCLSPIPPHACDDDDWTIPAAAVSVPD